MQKSYTDAVMQENLNPAGGRRSRPKDEDGKNFAYVATFEIMPEVALKDLERSRWRSLTCKSATSDIDDMILETAQAESELGRGRAQERRRRSRGRRF